MLKKVLALFVLVFAVGALSAQTKELKVVEPLHYKGSIGAADNRKTNNGEFCAVVDITLPGVDFVLDCPDIMVGEPVKKTGCTRVFLYVPHKTGLEKVITIRTDDYLPFKVVVSKENIAQQNAYEIVLAGSAELNKKGKPIGAFPISGESTAGDDLFRMGKEYFDRKDYSNAEINFRKSADLGNANGQYYLGVMHYYGQGFSPDYKESVNWFRKSAEQGDSNAQCFLGIMYLNGNGVTQDYSEAVIWFRKSAKQGNETAKRLLNKLEN